MRKEGEEGNTERERERERERETEIHERERIDRWGGETEICRGLQCIWII